MNRLFQARSRRSIALELVFQTIVFGLCLVGIVVLFGLAGPAT
jgi:hypothetical protein